MSSARPTAFGSLPQFVPLLLLLLIVLGAGLLRFVDLDGRPLGLFRDEAEKGYNAWLLATRGGVIDVLAPGDLTRFPYVWHSWPWTVNVIGTQTSAIYHYASIPFMALGGLSVTTTRAAAAAFGTLTILILGLGLMRAWGPWPGLAAALWLALCPWHLVFSRWALQGIFVPFWMALVLAGLWGWQARRWWGCPLAGAAMGWLFYSYSGIQPFVLVWGLALLACEWPRLQSANRRDLILLGFGILLFLVPVIPTVLIRLAPGGSERLARVAIWTDPAVDGPLKHAWQFIVNYAAHFDPRFLFWTGDINPRHSVVYTGQLNWIDTLLVPLGLFASFRQRRSLRWVLLAAFLLGPFPAALTRTGIPHGLRSIGMLLPAAIYGGLGLWTIIRWVHTKISGPNQRSLRLGWPAWLIAALIILLGLQGSFLYWKRYQSDPLVFVAFEASHRHAWERLLAQRRPGQAVYLNSLIPYVVYYQFFFTQDEPEAIVKRGVSVEPYRYFRGDTVPAEFVMRRMNPGDWLMDMMPAAQLPELLPELKLGDPQQYQAISERWVWLYQKPADQRR